MFQPATDCVVQHRVERGTIGAHPGLNPRTPFASAAATRRVDVHATDDFASAAVQHGVGEAAALGEVLRVAFEVAKVVSQGHRVRPASPGESRRRLDVVDAGSPRGIVGGVVLGPERLEPELLSSEPARHREIRGNELLVGHMAMVLASPPRFSESSSICKVGGKPAAPTSRNLKCELDALVMPSGVRGDAT